MDFNKLNGNTAREKWDLGKRVTGDLTAVRLGTIV